MPNPPAYRRQVLGHLGLVAGMGDELGMGDVLDQATHHTPALRDRTVGEAVNAMGLNGVGCIKQARYLVPRLFQNTPTYRLVSPRLPPAPRTNEALGRAWETLEAYGVTALSRLLAATAAEHLGLAPRCGHLESTSGQVDGRDHSAAEPEAQVVHMTRGDSREQRPDVNHVRWERRVEPQAGLPLLMTPRSGTSRETPDVGAAMRAPLQPWHPTEGLTSRVADRARSSAANLPKLAQTPRQWSPRVPATVRAAHAILAHADPPILTSLPAGYRDQACPASSGGSAHRGVLLDAERRQAQARPTVDQPWRQQRANVTTACQHVCRTTCACEAEARPALSTFEPDVHTLAWAARTVRAQPRDRPRGRPGPDARPERVVDQIDGALASTRTARQALLDQHWCVILATNELDTTPLPPRERLAGDKGQGHVERGFRWLQDPQLFAASLSLKKPERRMARLMVMTVGVLVYAALAYRIRHALHDQAATCPNQRGPRLQQPTARWVLQDVVGMPLRCQAGQWPIVLHLTAAPQHVLRLLGKPSMRLYDVHES